MTSLTSKVSDFVGSYVGGGTWIDITGESKRYRVEQRIELEGTALQVEYKHVFFEESETTSGIFVFEVVSDAILSVRMKGSSVGNGYVFGNHLRYHVRVGDMFVEAGYLLADDRLLVTGSSTKNSQGRYVAWNEALRRQDGDA